MTIDYRYYYPLYYMFYAYLHKARGTGNTAALYPAIAVGRRRLPTLICTALAYTGLARSECIIRV